MTRSCPEALQVLLEVVIGQRWPAADVAGLRDAAARWRTLGKAVTHQHAAANQAAGAVAENRGLGIEAFTAMWSRLSNTDVAELSRLCAGLATSLERFAGDTEACQDFIIIQLELLAAEVGFALVSGVFTFGIGELAGEAAVLATRAVIGTAIRELIEKAVSSAAKLALRGAAEAMLNDGLLQGLRAAHGASSFNADELFTTGMSGMAAGAVTAPATHLASTAINHTLDHALTAGRVHRPPDPPATIPASSTTTGAAAMTGIHTSLVTAAAATTGALAGNTAAAVTGSLVTGNPISSSDLLGGLAGPALHSTAHSAAHTITHHAATRARTAAESAATTTVRPTAENGTATPHPTRHDPSDGPRSGGDPAEAPGRAGTDEHTATRTDHGGRPGAPHLESGAEPVATSDASTGPDIANGARPHTIPDQPAQQRSAQPDATPAATTAQPSPTGAADVPRPSRHYDPHTGYVDGFISSALQASAAAPPEHLGVDSAIPGQVHPDDFPPTVHPARADEPCPPAAVAAASVVTEPTDPRTTVDSGQARADYPLYPGPSTGNGQGTASGGLELTRPHVPGRQSQGNRPFTPPPGLIASTSGSPTTASPRRTTPKTAPSAAETVGTAGGPAHRPRNRGPSAVSQATGTPHSRPLAVRGRGPAEPSAYLGYVRGSISAALDGRPSSTTSGLDLAAYAEPIAPTAQQAVDTAAEMTEPASKGRTSGSADERARARAIPSAAGLGIHEAEPFVSRRDQGTNSAGVGHGDHFGTPLRAGAEAREHTGLATDQPSSGSRPGRTGNAHAAVQGRPGSFELGDSPPARSDSDPTGRPPSAAATADSPRVRGGGNGSERSASALARRGESESRAGESARVRGRELPMSEGDGPSGHGRTDAPAVRAATGGAPAHAGGSGKRRRPDRRRLLSEAGLRGPDELAGRDAHNDQHPPEPRTPEGAHNPGSADDLAQRNGDDQEAVGDSRDRAGAESDAPSGRNRARDRDELEGLERVEEFDSLDELDAFDHDTDHGIDHGASGRGGQSAHAQLDSVPAGSLAEGALAGEASWDDPARARTVWRSPHGLEDLLVSAADVREVSEPLGVGEHMCEVCQVRFVDGSLGVYKPVSGEYQNPVLFGLARGEPAIREVAASTLDQLLGLGVVPPTVLWDGPQGPGSLQRWIHPAEPGWDVDECTRLDRERLAVLDYLTANNDRHWGNYLTDPHSHVVAIDHGYCFPPEPRMNISSGFVLDRRRQPLSDTIMDRLYAVTPGQLRARLAEAGLDPASIEGTLDRFAEIREHGMITGSAWPLDIVDPHAAAT